MLQRAYRAALPQLQRAAKLEPKEVNFREGLNYSVRSRFMDRSREIAKLNDLIRVRRIHLFLSEQYLKAAEEFDSPPLLAKAGLYIRSAEESAEFLEDLEKRPPSNLLDIELDTVRFDDFRTRIAVENARITSRAEDLRAAQALLESRDEDSYRRFGEISYRHGTDFCENLEHERDASTLKQKCEEESNLEIKVVDYWIVKAVFDLFAAAEGPDNYREERWKWSKSFDVATRLLMFLQMPDNGTRGGYRDASDDRFRLLLAKADYHARSLRGARAAADVSSRHYHWVSALSALREAELLARPFQAPGRFRRIAALWLELWTSAESLVGPRDEINVQKPDDRRYAEYLTANLRNLAAGEHPAPQ
jgi:hypothetical protein